MNKVQIALEKKKTLELKLSSFFIYIRFGIFYNPAIKIWDTNTFKNLIGGISLFCEKQYWNQRLKV